MFYHFVGLALKRLCKENVIQSFQFNSGAIYEKKKKKKKKKKPLKIGRKAFIVLFPRSPLIPSLSQKNISKKYIFKLK